MNASVFALTALLGALLLVTLWNALAAPRLQPRPPASRTRTSLLVPARNEAHGIENLLRAALVHSSADEILVLDDESTDGTAEIVRALAQESGGRVRLLRGTPLPAGWVGKSWACHQLARAAQHDLLVFCDADVALTGDAVAATAALMDAAGADVATALPRQQYGGLAERALIPLILHFPLLAFLPLPLLSRSGARALVFGNGQWLAFRRAAYERIGGHQAVRADVVEDMALVRRARALGLRTTAALARDVLAVRMYRGRDQLLAGFAKNLYPLLGGRPATAAPAAALFLALTLAPLALAAAGSFAPLALLVAIRALHARLTGAPLRDLWLHPLGVALALAALARSITAHSNGTVSWKSRSIPERRARAST